MKKIKKICIYLILFISVCINAGSMCYEYSDEDLMRDLRSLNFSEQEWITISKMLMNITFSDNIKDKNYIDKQSLKDRVLWLAFCNRWKKTNIENREYIEKWTGIVDADNNQSELKKLALESLNLYIKTGLPSDIFVSELFEETYSRNFSKEELYSLAKAYSNIKSNLVKYTLFFILMNNNFFKNEILPPEFINHLNSRLLKDLNTLRERYKLSQVTPVTNEH